MKDEEDVDVTATALRETYEEIMIPKERITVLGEFVQLPNRTGSVKVTSIVGYLGEIVPNTIQYNPNEVESIFTVDIDTLHRTTEIENFREGGMMIPSWTIQGQKIWGLTGYILGEFLQVAKKVGI
jgi:8-oxo-dGTP pyrophosphatase MutT (NUDIX family)